MSPSHGAFAAPTLKLSELAPRPAPHDYLRTIGLLAAMSAAVALPGGIMLATVGEASGLGLLAERPLAALQTGLGLLLCGVLLAAPAIRILSRLFARREIVLHGETVEILCHTPVGIRRRQVPISAYQGVAHHVRASLSGLAHEIVLVHPRSELSVVLMSVDRVTQDMMDECKALFGLPEVPARSIYGHLPKVGEAGLPGALSTAGA